MAMRFAAILLAVVLGGVAGAQGADEAEKLFATAMAAQQRGDLPEAITEYRRLLKVNPKLVDARVNLGAALAQTGQFEDAVVQYRQALAALPENVDVRRNLALAYYKKGDLAGAAREFAVVRKALPEDVSLAVLLADSEIRSGRGTEALAMLSPMEAANAGNMDFEYVMGTALLASGARRDGAAKLDTVAEATKGADVYLVAGSTWLDVNEAEKARKDLETAAALNPKLPGLYTLLGKARDHAGDPAAAEQAFREAIQANPDDFEANLYAGAILYKRRELEPAKVFLDKAVALNPASTMARYEVGMWKSTSGDYAAAAADLERVSKEEPEWLEPHVELASVYYRLHRPEEGAKQREIVARLTAEQQKRGPGK